MYEALSCFFFVQMARAVMTKDWLILLVIFQKRIFLNVWLGNIIKRVRFVSPIVVWVLADERKAARGIG